MLEAQFGIGKDLQPGDQEWESLFRKAVCEAVDAIPEDDELYGTNRKAAGKAEDRLEVLTMDEYRKRVGEEAYVRETFADRDRDFVGIPAHMAEEVATLQTVA